MSPLKQAQLAKVPSPEHFLVLVIQLQVMGFIKGPTPLVRHVVDDELQRVINNSGREGGEWRGRGGEWTSCRAVSNHVHAFMRTTCRSAIVKIHSLWPARTIL